MNRYHMALVAILAVGVALGGALALTVALPLVLIGLAYMAAVAASQGLAVWWRANRKLIFHRGLVVVFVPLLPVLAAAYRWREAMRDGFENLREAWRGDFV